MNNKNRIAIKTKRRHYREETSIPRVFFNQVKRLLLKPSCPFDFKSAFKQHDKLGCFSSLISIELLLWYINEVIDNHVAIRVRSFIKDHYKELMRYGDTKYKGHIQTRYEAYSDSANLLMKLLDEPGQSQRMNMLYDGNKNQVAGMQKLQ